MNISESVDAALIKQIADELNEPNLDLIGKVIAVIGSQRAQEFLQKTLAIEESGGMTVSDKSRRRSPGGVFFYTVRHTIPKAEAKQIWPPAPKGQAQMQPQAVKAPTWDEVKQLIQQAVKSSGEATTVKITLVGRPGKVVQQEACVVLTMKGKPPGALPKGVPTPPANSAITWAVFIANKQWNTIKNSIQTNEDDQLIVEGYPVVDPKSGTSVVLATNCKSMLLERAKRNPQKGS
jgi:hypothetical protein